MAFILPPGVIDGIEYNPDFKNMKPGKFLECFYTEANKEEALLDLLFTYKEELIGNVVGEYISMGDNDHEVIAFNFLKGGGRRESSRMKTLDLTKTDFRKFRILMGWYP